MYLNCHTWFSFKYGTMSVEALLLQAHRCGVKKIALTEINNTASYIEAFRTLKEHPEYDLELCVGIEFRESDQLSFIALAKNNLGFAHINRYRSYLNKEKKAIPQRAPKIDDAYIIYPWGALQPEQLNESEFIGIRADQCNVFAMHDHATEWPHKFVVLQPVSFANKQQFNTHRLLRAIHHNTLLSKLGPDQQAQANEVMVEEASLVSIFARFPTLIQNTRDLLSNCSLTVAFGVDKNKQSITGHVEKDWEALVQAAWEGFEEKYDINNKAHCERLQRELDVIKQKNFCAYYLIAHDMLRFADENGYTHVGRGSGANSLVAYCLGITQVDPIELDLYFERFLNVERSSPPDFDIDFSWTDRDFIYDYLFEKYGYDHVCLLGTHTTYQQRSVLRELAKVFGLPKSEIDELVAYPEANQHRDHIRELIFQYANHIIEMPSGMSIHAAGVLITEAPIYRYTATEMPPKNYPVSHFEMHNAEDIGIYKFDILSQRGLGHIREAIRLIKHNKGITVDIDRFQDFKTDEKIKKHLRESQTMGCFYVESPATRQLLGKLRCDDYLTLVAASSIIRPGVAQSGMMRAYIERFHSVRNGGTYTSIHPKMDEIMAETYGVMVYQEDVIKVAHQFAGLSLTEADVLRRGMSGKFRSRKEFKKVEESFFSNCAQRGYDKKVVDRVWYEIESFSGYSFAKGHSASFAVESYQSLYLKAHYPLEFMVGVINNFGGFYRTEFYVHEARKAGGKIMPPCVNNSAYTTTLSGNLIYLGFVHLKSLETELGKKIPQEREKNGPFSDLTAFLRRVPVGLEQVRILIRIGAFHFTDKEKPTLLWEAMGFYSQPKQERATLALFGTRSSPFTLPQLQRTAIEDAFDEIELLGFPLCDPFTLLDTIERGNTLAKELIAKTGQRVTMVGYLVAIKETRTKKKERMHFGTFYDHEGNVFDTVHFPNSARRYPFRGRGFYHISGIIMDDFGVAAINVNNMEKLPLKQRKELSEIG